MYFNGKSTPTVKSDDFDIDPTVAKNFTPGGLLSLGGALGSGREEREGIEGFVGHDAGGVDRR